MRCAYPPYRSRRSRRSRRLHNTCIGNNRDRIIWFRQPHKSSRPIRIVFQRSKLNAVCNHRIIFPDRIGKLHVQIGHSTYNRCVRGAVGAAQARLTPMSVLYRHGIGDTPLSVHYRHDRVPVQYAEEEQGKSHLSCPVDAARSDQSGDHVGNTRHSYLVRHGVKSVKSRTVRMLRAPCFSARAAVLADRPPL